jgi:hypothetical protein
MAEVGESADERASDLGVVLDQEQLNHLITVRFRRGVSGRGRRLFVDALASRYLSSDHGGAVNGALRRLVASVLAWIVGAVAAVGVGILALSLIGDGLTARTVQPLTPDVVAREAAAASAEPSSAPTGAGARPTPSKTAPPPPAKTSTGTEKLLSSPGGTAIARCSDGQVYLVSWSPEQGFRADDVDRGPGAQASLKFESSNAKVFLTVRCVGGEPQATVTQRGDDHGGGHK